MREMHCFHLDIRFEPEQRPRKRVFKRSVHGKQDVHLMSTGANKDTRQSKDRWNTGLVRMTRRSVHKKGTPEKTSHDSPIKHIMEENIVIKTKKCLLANESIWSILMIVCKLRSQNLECGK